MKTTRSTIRLATVAVAAAIMLAGPLSVNALAGTPLPARGGAPAVAPR